ncbi:MAG TPA: hypothetical protein VF415_00900 [Rhodanobacter sp.]
MPNRLPAALVAIAIGSATPALPAQAAAAPPGTHCDAPVYRQFDYWLGDWDTYRVDKTGKVPPGADSVARNRVTAILGGCVLHEVYRRADGYTGESFTIYDATRHVWHQSWVTNEGELLVAEGGRQGKAIVLTGAARDAQGTQLQRVSWTPQGDGVRETAMQSRDGGKTWAPLFDILFRPHRP